MWMYKIPVVTYHAHHPAMVIVVLSTLFSSDVLAAWSNDRPLTGTGVTSPQIYSTIT